MTPRVPSWEGLRHVHGRKVRVCGRPPVRTDRPPDLLGAFHLAAADVVNDAPGARVLRIAALPRPVDVRARPLGGAMIDDEEEGDHQACVAAWLERSAPGLTAGQLLEAFELAFSTLWHRAHRTLGDVTLTAIVDRVLYNATLEFPLLDSLVISATGVSAAALRARANQLDPDQVSEAIRFVLVEFLTVLGTLTGDILTPALHAQLSVPVAPPPGPPDDDRNRAIRGVDGAES